MVPLLLLLLLLLMLLMMMMGRRRLKPTCVGIPLLHHNLVESHRVIVDFQNVIPSIDPHCATASLDDSHQVFLLLSPFLHFIFFVFFLRKLAYKALVKMAMNDAIDIVGQSPSPQSFPVLGHHLVLILVSALTSLHRRMVDRNHSKDWNRR
jgi:hypothetical protein